MAPRRVFDSVMIEYRTKRPKYATSSQHPSSLPFEQPINDDESTEVISNTPTENFKGRVVPDNISGPNNASVLSDNESVVPDDMSVASHDLPVFSDNAPIGVMPWDNDLNENIESSEQTLVASGFAQTASDDEDPVNIINSAVATDEFIQMDSVEDPVNITDSTTAMDEFELALALWTVQCNLSRANYTKLLEVLSIVTDIDQLRALPSHRDTLHKHLSTNLPLLSIKKAQISVDGAVQPARGSKDKTTGNGVSSQLWYEPASLFKSILSSDIGTNRMHFGMAEYVDKPLELWHSKSWGSSIRAASGDFAKTGEGDVIFPGDFVEFDELQTSDNQIKFAFGRVIFVGRDQRKASLTRGLVVLTLQAVVYPNEIPCDTDNEFHEGSMILLEDETCELVLSCIRSRVDIEICYNGANLKPCRVDWVFNRQHQLLRPATKLHPLRGELEVAQYGRDYLSSLAFVHTRAIPILLFIDGFGIYRNVYRSFKAFYVTPASLSYADRRKISNVFTLTLGPHGASLDNTVKSFQEDFQKLEKGILVNINNKATLLNAFVLCYTGDMPQQAANSGFLSHNAGIGCRNCRCPKEDRGNLNYDILSNGRYHYEVLRQREEGDRIGSATRREQFFRSHGLQSAPSCLQLLTPALDLIMSRGCDVPHSEWKGLGRLMHDLLVDVILTPTGQREYFSAFSSFTFPFKWPPIQNPQRHRASWSLSELGRAIVLIPLIMRANANNNWVRSAYAAEAENTLRFLQPSKKPPLSSLNLIIRAYSVFAAAVSAVSSTVHCLPYKKLHSAILDGRRVFHQLIRATSYDASINKEWSSKLNLPNIHIGLHLSDFAVEYGCLMNCNVLAGEMKHKQFKKLADQASPSNLMPYLFHMDLFRQSLRLAFAGAWRSSHEDLTHRLSLVQARCPTLTEMYISSCESGLLHLPKEKSLMFRGFGLDETWKSFISTLDIDISGPLFYERLHQAYQIIYGINNIDPTDLYNQRIYSNMRIRDSNHDRDLIYRTGQFFYYRQTIVRLICFVVHEITSSESSNVFFVIQELQRCLESDDEVLSLPCYKATGEWYIIGYQSLSSDPLFLVDLTCSSGSPQYHSVYFTHSIWHVDYL